MTQFFDKPVLSHARLIELLDYNQETGVLTWRQDHSSRARAGGQAGKPRSRGYGGVQIDGVKYPVHKLVIYWYSGLYPYEDVDHRDGDRSNNRLRNLRCAGPLLNAQNRRKPSKNNKTGFLGVAFCKSTRRYRVQILVERKKIHVGRYDTPEAAHAAYLAAKRTYHSGNTL